MAEIVNIASFEMDTARLETSLTNLQKRYADLRLEQTKYNNLTRESQKAILDLEKAQALLESQGEENSEQYEENAKALDALNEVYRQNSANSMNVANNMKAVRTELNNTEKQLRSYMDGMGEFSTLQDQANAQIRTEIRNKNDALAANVALQKISNQLNPEREEEAELLKRVNEQIDANTKFIKENSSATAQQAMNVGNYTESIQEALRNITPFNSSIGEFVTKSNEVGGVGNLVTGTFKGIGASIAGATKAALAFIATPLGAALAAIGAVIGVVVGAFKFMTASMNSTEAGSNRLAKVTASVTGVFNGLFKVVRPLGEFLGNVFISAIEDAGEAIETMVGLVEKGLRLVGMSQAADTVKQFSDAAKQGAKDAAALADAEAKLAAANREAQLTQLEYQRAAEKLRQIRDDESRSMNERIEANKQLGEVLKQQMQAELAIANQALRVADLRIKSEGKTTEALDARAEALTRIADIQERITGQESEQLTNLNSLRREAAQQQAEREKQAIENARKRSEEMVKSMQQELELYTLSQGNRKRDMQEQLDMERQIYEQRMDIAKTQYERKLISEREYQIEVLKIQNEYGAIQTQIAIENADAELAAFIEGNQRKIEENQYFNDELYNQELERLNAISEAQAANATARFEQGVINEREYREAIAAIDAEYYEAKQAVDAEREEAQKAKEAADLAIQIEAAGEAFQYDLALQMQQYEQMYAQRKAAAEAAGADMIAFEEAEAKKSKKIEEAVQRAKMDMRINALNNVAAVLGQESAMGKAAAVAATTISTYQSAVDSYKGMVAAMPGPWGIAAGIAAAAASVAMGIANVKKILAVETPKTQQRATPSYARGGMVTGAGTGTSDSINARVSDKESIMTARATSMFPSTLSVINQIGGGVPLDNTLSSAIVQGRIQDSAGVDTQAIAEAVADGAARGTAAGAQTGIVELSDNRRVMQESMF